MAQTGRVEEKFNRTLSTYHMLDSCTCDDTDNGQGVLVGYSGGADSSALLWLLREVCAARGIFLKAVHVHHGIRGGDADRDAAHCAAVCKHLGVEIEIVTADIPALARAGGRGIEETARDFRYALFSRMLGEDARLGCVATAHNADDNAETMLFNLARGTGIDGLTGIPPVRALEHGRVIRPLIACTKSEILEYCRENRIDYQFDSTNDDQTYTRNYIRHDLLPRFARLNPSYLAAFDRLNRSAAADADYLSGAADDFIARHAHDNTLDAAALTAAHEAIRSRALIRVFARVSDAMLETVHLHALTKLCQTARENASLSLPGGVTAGIERGNLRFTRDTASVPAYHLELKPGINRHRHPDFAVLFLPDAAHPEDFQKDNECLKNIYKLSIHTLLKSDRIKHILYLRPKRDGDAYHYGNMTRKLKKLYNDRGLTQRERRELPVLCDGEGILWVPGFGVADRAEYRPGDEAAGQVAAIAYYYNNEVEDER